MADGVRHFLLPAAAFGVPSGVLAWAVPGVSGATALGAGVLSGVVFGAAMAVFAALVRRRDGVRVSGEERIELGRAARTGSAPADPALDPVALTLIERRRGQVRWADRVNRVIFVVFALMGVLWALAGQRMLGLALVVVAVGLVVATRVAAVRRTAQFDVLERAIRERVRVGG